MPTCGRDHVENSVASTTHREKRNTFADKREHAVGVQTPGRRYAHSCFQIVVDLIRCSGMYPPALILLVQPERDDREMYAEFLGSEGFLPISVSSAADALTIAPRVDVVVTALLLPGPMDGVELVARLKGD